jgi:D-alanyl-lipoteichoic acid acyltransferase DltB (MBOAT superfamily)
MWHGANWTFLVWGLHHAVLLIASRFTEGIRAAGYRVAGLDRNPRLLAALETGATFWAVMIGWIFFRAPSLEVAGTMLHRIATNWAPAPSQHAERACGQERQGGRGRFRGGGGGGGDGAGSWRALIGA